MLGYALDIAGALERDRSQSLEQRHRRDREIAKSQDLLPVPASRAGRLRVLECWWQQVQAEPGFEGPAEAAAAQTLDRARRIGGYLLFLVGLLLGAAVSAAALHYDGSAPVNLISVLAVLVVVPGLMLLLTLLLLPGRLHGLGWLQDVLVTFSPGQWLSAWFGRRYDSAQFGWYARTDANADYRSIGKWQVVVYSQVFAVGFFIASLGTLLLLVTFSDLAFGWSTTLDVEPARVAQWTANASQPWAALAPAAAPNTELVLQSQFYRAQRLRPEQVTGLGDWWPFLLLAVTCYGLLPRLLLLGLGQWRLRRAEQALLLGNPQVSKLFERLATPIVLHQVDSVEAAAPIVPAAAAVQPAAQIEVAHAVVSGRLLLPAGDVAVVNWNETIAPDALAGWLQQTVGAVPAICLELGARTEPAMEQQSLAQLHVDAVVVLAKAWEPPLLEFMDFTTRLKQALGAQGVVQVTPVGIKGALPSAADFAIWEQMIGGLEDVRIVMGPLQ
ncbi:MAG: DUF2868 domain-containing protein [Pseudomonadales bacterium]